MLAWCSSFREVPYNVIKPFCTYLLNRYLGCYLLNKQINIEQLSVDIFAGKGSLKEVNLDVRYINEALSDANIPLQLFDGFIHEISLNVPWSRLLEDCCLLEVDGLELTLKASSMQQLSQMNSVLESFMASMTTSFELARSFVEEHNGKCKRESVKEESVHFEVVAPLVHLIDAILSRMRLVVQNIVLRLEHYVGDRGIGLELRIDKLEFFDGQLEANRKSDAASAGTTGLDLTQKNDRFFSKVITLSTVRCYTDWFVPIISLKNLSELRKSGIARSSSFSANKTDSGSVYASCVTNAQNSDSCSSSFDRSLSHQGHVFSEPYLFAILAAEPLTFRLQISRSIESQLVEVNATLGSAYLLVSPRCLKLLIELAQAFLSPDNVDRRATSRCGAMNRSDFEKIEKELKRKINSEFAQAPNIGARTDQGDNWVGTDKFYPMTKEDPSFLRSGQNLLDASVNGAQGNFARYPPHTSAVSGSTRFKLIFNSVWISLTYEDFCVDQNDDAESASRKVINRFFKTSATVMLNSVVDLSLLRPQCDGALALDHIRFISSPVVIDMTFGGQIGSPLCSSTLNYLRVVCRNCELVECLPAHEPANRYTELLVFDQTVAKLADQPNILLKIISGDDDNSFTVELNPCRVELDVTAFARMQPFIETLWRCCSEDSSPPYGNGEVQEVDLLSLKPDLFDALERDHPSSGLASRVRLSCSLAVVDVRIPIPNLINETTHQKSKILRDERLRVKLGDFCLTSSVDKLFSRKGAVSIDFTSAYVQFLDHQRVSINICRCFSTSKACNLSINWTTLDDLDQLSSVEKDPFDCGHNGGEMNHRSYWESMMNNETRKSSWNPFSKTSVAYEGESLRIVGNFKELRDFRNSTSSRCLMNFCCNLDQVNLLPPSKELLELVFNRLLMDLPLWFAAQPCASDYGLPTGHTMPIFYEFQPDEVDPDQSLTADDCHRVAKGDERFRWSLTVNVNHVVSIVNLTSNVEDNLSLAKFDGNCIEFFVIMTSQRLEPDVLYFYFSTDLLGVLQGADAQWTLSSPILNVDDDKFGDCDSSMTLIVKSTSPSMNLRRKEDACFSLAGKTHLSRHTELPCRHLLLTLGFRDLTLYADSPNDIYKLAVELGGYMHLEAYPIEGYIPPPVITDLHTHCWNLSVVHRPRAAPLVVLVNVNSVNMASNLAMDAAVFRLHFIIEDSALYLLKLPAGKSSASELAIKDFVCLMRMGFFDLVVTCRGQPNGQAAFDFHARNDSLHLYTCSDSAALLAVLLRCCMETTNGDSAVDNDPPKGSTCASFRSSDVAADLMESAIEDKFKSLYANESDATHDDSLSSEAANSTRSDESFMLLENIPGSGIANPCGQPVVRLLDEGHEVTIKNDHFALPCSKMDHLNALPPEYPSPLVQYYFQQISIVWHLYGGCDFASSTVSAGCESSSIPGGCFYSETGTKFQIGDGFNRDRRLSVDFSLSKISFLHQRFPADFGVRSRQVVTVQDFEIADRLPISKVTKLLSAVGSTQGGVRQSSTPMLCIRCMYVVPSADERSVFPLECCLKVALVPLKLSIDQDTFEFMQNFFHDVDRRLADLIPSVQEATPSSERTFSETRMAPQDESSRAALPTGDPCLLYQMHSTYYRSFSVCPAVQLKLEYFGKRIDIDYGALQGLLMGLSRLHCTELILKELDNRHGLLGIEKVVSYALNEWLTDIRQNQLLNIVGSVGPLHNVSEIAQGIRDLFWMPVDEFRKDGRIIRGLHRGAHSFGITTAAALLELTQKFFQTVHTVAEFAFDVVSPDYAQAAAVGERYLIRASPSPSDFREGLAMACKTVYTGFSENPIGSRSEGKARNRWMIGNFLRQATPCVFRPILVASQATHQILGGIKSHFRADE